MENNLISYIESGEYAELYSDKNDLSKFIFGKIIRKNDVYIIIAAISPKGSYDGFLLKKINDIIKICRNTKYKEDLLYKINKSELIEFNIEESGNPLIDLLCFAQSNNLVVSIELLSSGYTEAFGFVNEIDNQYISINQIDENGDFDGITYLYTKDITQISVDSEEERTETQ